MQIFQNEQSRRKVLIQEKKAEKESAKNITEEVVYDELFIAQTSNQ